MAIVQEDLRLRCCIRFCLGSVSDPVLCAFLNHADIPRSAFGATAYTAGISGVVMTLDTTMQVAILGLSLYLLGIAFAPIITPHLSERFGRQAVYLVSFPIFGLFILGASFSQSFGALAVCRFFAGFFGGPALVYASSPSPQYIPHSSQLVLA